MEEQRKPTRWGLWLVVGLVVFGYPLASPPIHRLMVDGYLPKATGIIFHPWYATTRLLPKWIPQAHYRYQLWWVPNGYTWTGNKARAKPAP